MSDTQYLHSLTPRDYLRIFIRVERPRTVVAFTAQYETIVDNVVYPVIRYDSAHGYPHRDTLNAEGQVVDKFWFAGWENDAALSHAIRDLKSNYLAYRAAFLAAMR